MIRKPISYGRQHITEEDIQAVVDTLKSDYLTQGPKIPEFEQAFARYVGAKYAVAVNNATAGLHLAAGALGVKLAIGDKREVYAMCGDGSFNMLHGELVTAVMERKKINICLFDNASFGCINNLQVGHGNVTLCTELRYRSKDGLFGDFLNIDYAKVAEGYGCKSYSIRTMEELAAAFEDAKKVKDRPVLFDIKVLPKTMTDGYGSWWRVGDTEVSERPENLAAYQDHLDHVRDARKY